MDLPASNFNQQTAAVTTEDRETTSQPSSKILHQKLWRILDWCLQKPTPCQFDSYALFNFDLMSDIDAIALASDFF